MSAETVTPRPHANRGVRRLRAKRQDALGLDAHEVAALYGIGVAGFYRLLGANPDHPRRTSPLWPGGRGKFDRAECVRWWRAFVRRSKQVVTVYTGEAR